MTDGPSVHDAKQKAKVRADIERFRDLVADADVTVVGEDHEYVPDSPRLKRTHPNAG